MDNETDINDKNKNDFIFPFSTCEKPKKNGIAQPFSVVVNILSIIVILYFLCQTKNIYTFILIFTLLAFECVHTFSHAVHLPNYIQLNIIHTLAYIVNLFYLLTLYNYTHVAPTPFFLVILTILILFDIYSFLYLSFVFYFSSSLLTFFSILIFYYKYIPKDKKQYIFIIISLIVSILFLFYNEFFNCKRMLKIFPDFPFHAVSEIAGLIIFYYICKLFSSF
jgi:hypothetical protein